MKIAQFCSLSSDNISPFKWYPPYGGETDSKMPGAVRVSQWIEVDFPPRPPEEYVPEQIKELDAAEKELRGKFLAQLNMIAEARARVLSLTHDAPDAPAASPLKDWNPDSDQAPF